MLGEQAREEAAEISALNKAKEPQEIASTGQLDRWTKLKDLDSGGQGKVSLVIERGKDFVDSIVEPLAYLIKGTKSSELLAECRTRFRDALPLKELVRFTDYTSSELQHSVQSRLVEWELS
jgi:hypothetical protein